MEVYLDNSATTAVFPQVADLMYKIMTEDYGNPSSMHQKGIVAEKYLRHAKEIFAGILKVSEKEIFFTSGGTESDNFAVIGSAMAGKRRGILLQPILNILQFLKPSSSLKTKALK